MKELSIEEKAARYDKAIEKLRSLHDDYDTVSTLIDIKEELEQIFPELKESDDEKIRKEIIKFIKASKPDWKNYRDYSSWIAWLEKQGDIDFFKSLKERYTWKPSDEQIQALEYQVYSTYEGSWQYRASKELLEQLKKL